LRRLWRLLVRAPDFRRLFLALVISLAGDWFAFVAVSGLVTEVTGRPGLPSFIYAASVLPVFFLSPVAGVIADRVDRKWMMVIADATRVPVALGLCLAAMWGNAALAVGCMLVLAVQSTFFDPVASAALPNLVEPEDLPIAQAAANGAWGAMLFVGAGLGGLVTVAIGRQAAFIANAATFAVSAILVARIKRPLQQGGRAPSAGIRADLREVRDLVRAKPAIGALLLCKCGVGSANGIVGLLPVIALGRFGAGDAGTGALLASRGIGALLGPIVAGWIQLRARGTRGVFLICGGAAILYGIAYAFLPLVPAIAAACALVIVAHMGGGAQWTLSVYGLQLATPDAIRGRVLSIDYGIATLSIGVSSVLAGIGAEVIGATPTIWGLVAVAIGFGAVWLAATRRYWRVGAPDPLA
jgi:predicted MFS family arabinose efflux permease